MKENYYGIYLGIDAHLKRYEKKRDGSEESPYEIMLNILQAPYCDFNNYDDFLAALQEAITPEEAEAWCAFPDFNYMTRPISVEEASVSVRSEMKLQLEGLAKSLAEKKFLYEDFDTNGTAIYMRTYLFDIACREIFEANDTKMYKACLDWWMYLVDGQGSAKLRAPLPEYRVLPHEGTLTGKDEYGRIPMNLEIPDNREVLPMDLAEELLKERHSIAVIDCVCRTARDRSNKRTCDYTPNGVCFIFDHLADGEIAVGNARAVSVEEAKQLLRQCRDAGLVQSISDAKKPLSLCNCCSCCCVCLVSIKRHEDTLIRASRFLADSVYREKCVSCGLCVKACPMEAITLENGVVQIKGQSCIGCGICASRCPKAVIKMLQRFGADDRFARDTIDRIYL